MRKTLRLLPGLLALLAATGCTHKDLCYTHPHAAQLMVIFDWRNDPAADPATMSLYLYDTARGQSERYEFVGKHGGVIRVSPGTYDALGLNSDTEKVRLRNLSTLDGTEIYSEDTDLFDRSIGMRGDDAPRAEGTGDERISHPAERLWTDRTRSIDLTRFSTTETVSDTIVLYPSPAWCNYDVTIRNADNVRYATNISGALSSMAGGLRSHDAGALDERVTVPFLCDVDDATATVTGAFRVWEHCPLEQNTHMLTIYCFLEDGTRWYYTYDVTGQVHDAPDRRNVHIVIDGLSIPKPVVSTGGGFRPTVEEWEGIEIPLPM